MSDAPDTPTPEELELAERGRQLVAATARERAPDALRMRLEGERRRAQAEHSWRGQLRVLVPAAAGIAAMIVLVVVIAVGSGGRTPSVNAVALVALRGHEGPAPSAAPGRPYALDVSVDGVPFPAWRGGGAWRAAGVRDDTVGGRTTRTVFYRGRSGREIAYGIVGGDALDVPAGTSTIIDGVAYTTVDDGARRFVTWRRGGHTCVVSAPKAVPAKVLLDLAAWRGAQLS